VAIAEAKTGHIVTNENPADIATKITYGGQKRNYLMGKLLMDITDHD
jgi:hypothetical protein